MIRKTVLLTWEERYPKRWVYRRAGRLRRWIFSSEDCLIGELLRLYPNLHPAGEWFGDSVQRLLGQGKVGVRVKVRERNSSSPIDRQRAKVYRAEDRLPEMRPAHNMTRSELIDFAEGVLHVAGRSRLWRVRYSKRMHGAVCRPGELVFGQMRTPLIVLHEVAHAIQRDKKEEAHGPDFCRRYLDLVVDWMGEDVMERLHEAMKAERVRVWSAAAAKKGRKL